MNEDLFLSELVDELEQIHDSGDIEEYIRFTGEKLAEADSRWRHAAANGADATVWLSAIALLAPAHVSALLHSRRDDVEAFSAALTFMVALDYADRFILRVPGQALVLVNCALEAFNRLSSAMPRDEFTLEHVPVIWRYLGSLLSFYYKMAVAEDPNNPYLGDSRDMLDELRAFESVDSGTVDVNGETVDLSKPAPMLLDMIARATALGVFSA